MNYIALILKLNIGICLNIIMLLFQMFI